jgi:hypothetical protein
MKVSLRIAFAMSRFSNVKALYEGFVVKINGRDWTVNIMMSSEKPHLHCWRVMNLRSKMIPLVRDSGGPSC